MDELIDRDRDRVLFAQKIIASRVANEEDWDASLIQDGGDHRVVGGEHRPFFATLLSGSKVRDCGAHINPFEQSRPDLVPVALFGERLNHRLRASKKIVAPVGYSYEQPITGGISSGQPNCGGSDQ